jgi:hypothetical protein
MQWPGRTPIYLPADSDASARRAARFKDFRSFHHQQAVGFKALTTFASYGQVATPRQAELIR